MVAFINQNINITCTLSLTGLPSCNQYPPDLTCQLQGSWTEKYEQLIMKVIGQAGVPMGSGATLGLPLGTTNDPPPHIYHDVHCMPSNTDAGTGC